MSEAARKVVQGNCGWSDQSLSSCGKYFSSKSLSSVDKLKYLSKTFGCIEVDSSTYAIPSISSVQKWIDCTPSDFIFHFKAFGLLCSGINAAHLPTEIKELSGKSSGWITLDLLGSDISHEIWKMFNDSVSYAYKMKKLGFVLFQFFENFIPCQKSYQHLAYCARELSPEYRICFDFKNRLWLDSIHLDETVAFLKTLRSEGIVLAASDDL